MNQMTTPPDPETPTPPKPLFPCAHCSDDYTWPADDLNWSEKAKEWVCPNCWEDDEHGEEKGIRLDTQLERYRDAALAEVARLRGALDVIQKLAKEHVDNSSLAIAVEILARKALQPEERQKP